MIDHENDSPWEPLRPGEDTGLLELTDNADLTLDGKVLKGAKKVEKLGIRVESRVMCHFYSWQIDRYARRDYNFTFRRICNQCRNYKLRKTVKALLADIMSRGEILKDEVEKINSNIFSLEVSEFSSRPFRLCSAECASLVKAMANADLLIAKLNIAVKQGLISMNDAGNLIRYFLVSFLNLKNFLQGRISPANKTLKELSEEENYM